MTTGKEHKPEGTLHRRQLFYWMGRSIDEKNKGRKVLSDALVDLALTQLRGSFENGLWVKTPRYPEQFDFGRWRLSLELPITCFTEWSLAESLPHTMEYGRIGLGFPKRWVIERGGQPVTYFRHQRRGTFLQSIQRLLLATGTVDADGEIRAGARKSEFNDLLYLLHFSKMIRLQRRKPVRRAVPKRVKPAAAPRSAAQLDAQIYRRKFGHPLPFVEEREWRIVYSDDNKYFQKGPGTPAYYLPYVPGEELFTLVVPDSKVLSRVLENDWFTTRLFTPWKVYPALRGRPVPPVTLMAHSDIGTF